jgi:hypothetical protein
MTAQEVPEVLAHRYRVWPQDWRRCRTLRAVCALGRWSAPVAYGWTEAIYRAVQQWALRYAARRAGEA